MQELADHVIAECGVRHGQVVYLPAHGVHPHRAGGREITRTDGERDARI